MSRSSSGGGRGLAVRPVLASTIVDARGHEVRRLRVFCAREGRSTDLERCRRCPAFVEVAAGPDVAGEVRCVAPRSERTSRNDAAGSVLHGSPLCVEPDVPISALRKLVAERDLPFLLVVSDAERVIGMVWPTRLERPAPADALAHDVMSSACTAEEFASMRQVLLLMAAAHLRWLPIVAPDGTPIGVLRDVEALRAWAAARTR